MTEYISERTFFFLLKGSYTSVNWEEVGVGLVHCMLGTHRYDESFTEITSRSDRLEIRMKPGENRMKK